MFKGYYTLTSSMLTQNRNMDVISNNLTNISTPGYKKEQFVSGSFKDVLYSQTANNVKGAINQDIGNVSMITAPYETVTSFDVGAWDETGGNLDFAIKDKGFFKIKSDDGVKYTRNGSFVIDDEGYLSLQGQGRVEGKNGDIYMSTDNINVDKEGNIISSDGQILGTLDIVDFADYTQLEKAGDGVFTTNTQEIPVAGNLMWKTVEASNVNAIDEMTAMLSSQRVLQSAAQVLKMYDQLASKAATEIGRV
ncbi:MAG TPA: flagellar hook-basal body protein [Lachnospiraceae bacterium]|nr:flagellar hook-basal body protein [Lachnospiraceae bacterium]